MSTIRKIIERVDENKPNSFSTETKVLWLAQLDGKVTADVFLMDVAEVRQFTYDPVTDLDTELLVRFPHDDIYYYWLCAKIDAENGEYDKYQNTMQLYNASYNNFVGWFLGCYEPTQCGTMRRRVPSYYITAYGLAVKRGFEGTIDEWLDSLRGKSAYTIAVEKGFEGSEIQWLQSMIPYIGVNGNWWIGETDTGVVAGYVGPVIPAGIQYGDVNGDGAVDAKDARQVSLYLSGEITAGQLRLDLADVNADGVVDEADAELINQYSAGLIAEFAAGRYLNWTPQDEYFYCDLTVNGITAQTEIMVVAPGVEIVKTECMEGAIRVYVTEVPAQNIPYSLHFGCSGSAGGSASGTVTSIDFSGIYDGSFTEVVDGEEVSHSVTFDESGRPATVDGVTMEWPAEEEKEESSSGNVINLDDYGFSLPETFPVGSWGSRSVDDTSNFWDAIPNDGSRIVMRCAFGESITYNQNCLVATLNGKVTEVSFSAVAFTGTQILDMQVVIFRGEENSATMYYKLSVSDVSEVS